MTWLSERGITQRPRVTLAPLEHAHHDALVEAVTDGELWKLWYTWVPPPESMAAEIERRLKLYADGTMLPFTVIDNSNARPVGMTTFMNVDADESSASRSVRRGTARASSAAKSTRKASC